MNIFSVNDFDWYIGASKEDCAKKAAEDLQLDPSELEVYELSEEQLRLLTFEEESDPGSYVTRSFGDQLQLEIEKGGEFPRMFASTEY